jgi:hypothetical protein
MSQLPPIPDSFDAGTKGPSQWGMHLNDKIGCCTVAAAANMIQADHYAAGRPYMVPDADVLSAYEAITGYNPDDPNSDSGAYLIQVLQYWAAKGISGNINRAFALVDRAQDALVHAAIYLFNGIYAGMWVPKCIEGAEVWDYVEGSENLGGHCIWLRAFNYTHTDGKVYPYAVESWNQLYPVTQACWDNCFDEARVKMEKAILLDTGGTITGFGWNDLLNDMKLVQYPDPSPINGDEK